MQDLIRPDPSISPREIFARMQGAWFEPRIGSMWQENTGVTPTTSGGQTIGKLVDLSAGRVASQATAANRPTLQYNGNLPLIRHADSTDVLAAIMPAINVRRNLLTYSEQFDNAIWAKTNGATITPNTVAAPDSSVTADTLSISPYTYIYQAVNLVSGVTYTLSFYARTLSGNKQFRSSAYKEDMTIISAPKTASTNWTRFSFTFTSTKTSFVYIYPCLVDDLVSADIAIFGAQLELGSVATDYQKITDWTSEQYSSAGAVYFGVPQGMSCLHNQSIGTSYNLPALQTDIYGVVITPARLAPPLEQRLARYMNRLAGLSDAEFFWQEDYGPDVVTNGGFDTDSAWIKGIDWSISGGVASVVQNASFQNLTQECLTAGKVYIVTFTITQAANVSDGIRITLDGGTTFSAYYKTPGTYSFTAAATIGLIIFQNLNADISVDNISVREVLDGQVGQLLADDNDTILLRA